MAIFPPMKVKYRISSCLEGLILKSPFNFHRLEHADFWREMSRNYIDSIVIILD